MTKPDISFGRYVAARKGEASARARQGAVYAYAGDRGVRATIEKVPPVMLAVQAGARFWQTAGRTQLLASAVRVSDRQFPQIQRLVEHCADVLQIPVPGVYVAPGLGSLTARTLGAADDAVVVVDGSLIDRLSDTELLSVIGQQCGHIHNGHAVYLSALHFLQTTGGLVVRWAARPAVLALLGWARRAVITCDRASLLCTRDLEATTAALVKLTAAPGPRVAALKLFAATTFYRSGLGQEDAAGPPALSMDDCDAQVARLLAAVT